MDIKECETYNTHGFECSISCIKRLMIREAIIKEVLIFLSGGLFIYFVISHHED